MPKDANLTDVQLKASKGYLRKCMQGYIQWLIPQLHTLPDQLQERFVAYRAKAQRELKGCHDRTPGTVAHLMLGYDMYIRYQQHVLGVDDQDFTAGALQHAWDNIVRNCTAQIQDVGETNPARMFLDALREMVINGTATIKELGDLEHQGIPKGMVGYKDSRFYYFLPDVSFSVVCEQYRKKGQEFPGTRLAMMQRMREDGMCVADKDGKPTKGKSINGRTQRYLTVPLHVFDGEGKQQVEQLSMPVNVPDNPFA